LTNSPALSKVEVPNEFPIYSVDFRKRSVVRDPYPVYEDIRALGRVVYNPTIDHYMVTSYADCARIKGNSRMFTPSIFGADLNRIFGGRLFLTEEEVEWHKMVRSVWTESFSRRSLEQHRQEISEIVQRWTADFINGVSGGATVDAVTPMLRRIPAAVISSMMGVEEEWRELLSDKSDKLGEAMLEAGYGEDTESGEMTVAHNLRLASEALDVLTDFFANLVAERRKKKTDDLLSEMVYSDAARQLSDTDLIANLVLLFFGGNETTAKLMASALVALSEHPEQRGMLATDRSLIPQAVEETHRWMTVVQLAPRHARTDESEVGGMLIPRGAGVMVLQAAANRDPDRWDNPAEFDINRTPKQHFGFGFGMHNCLAQNLARMEVEVWLDQLLDGLPDFQVAGELEYGTNLMTRSPLVLPIAAGTR
jgi:cytochrome P450